MQPPISNVTFNQSHHTQFLSNHGGSFDIKEAQELV